MNSLEGNKQKLQESEDNMVQEKEIFNLFFESIVNNTSATWLTNSSEKNRI